MTNQPPGGISAIPAPVLLSQTCQYAVRALIDLARDPGEGPKRVADVAERLDAPRNYLSKILHQLARQQILASERGPKGGFRLTVPPEELTLARVVEAVDRSPRGPQCLLGRPECLDHDPCPVHAHWRELAGEIEDFLESTTLADLMVP